MSDNLHSQKFLLWSERQQAWLESQINSVMRLKAMFEKQPLDDNVEAEIKKHEQQNEQLNILIKEYDILQKEIQPTLFHDKKNQEIVKKIKELIQTLLQLNEELAQIISQQKENLQKEMNDFFPLKYRFEKYNPKDKKTSDYFDYDV